MNNQNLTSDNKMLKNTPLTYGSIAKFFHWSVALLFIAAYVNVYYRHWFTEPQTGSNWLALQLHLSFGVSIFVLVILRVLWRWFSLQPNHEPGTPLEHKLAKWGHIFLYVIMFGMPVTGYLGTSVDTEFFTLFNMTQFGNTPAFLWISEATGLSFEEWEVPIDFLHKDVGGKLVVWLMIVGHVGAALYHHFIKKDKTLIKMLPVRK